MSIKLKTHIINLKTMSQHIEDPILTGENDYNGWTLMVIFTQEAYEQFTPNTKVYLSWEHVQNKVQGYNVFTHYEGETKKYQTIYYIHYPAAMQAEGDVKARIELVDEISITPSSNFRIHILDNPNTGSNFENSDDYSLFTQAVLDMNNSIAINNEKIEELNELQERLEEIYDSLVDYSAVTWTYIGED